MQRVARLFEAGIRAHPQDWHMLHSVFVADLDPARLAAAKGAAGAGALRAGHKRGPACPYSWDGRGEVQEHIRDPAEPLMDLVHQISVISPAGMTSCRPATSCPPAGRLPSPATARGGHLEVARPVRVLSGSLKA